MLATLSRWRSWVRLPSGTLTARYANWQSDEVQTFVIVCGFDSHPCYSVNFEHPTSNSERRELTRKLWLRCWKFNVRRSKFCNRSRVQRSTMFGARFAFSGCLRALEVEWVVCEEWLGRDKGITKLPTAWSCLERAVARDTQPASRGPLVLINVFLFSCRLAVERDDRLDVRGTPATPLHSPNR